MKKNRLIEVSLILGLGVVLVALESYYRIYTTGYSATSTRDYLSASMFFVAFIAMFFSLLLARNMFIVAKQEQTMELQKLYIQHLQDMMQVIKAQRHDFINHLQVVYGLLRIEENGQAQDYIGELYQDVQVSGEILRLSIPELTALLMVKMGVATGRGISLKIGIESSLAELGVRPLDIAAIVGNLLNNALEAVEDLNAAQRTVELRICENIRYFVVQTRNPGFIPPEIREQIFKSGFSTKSGTIERGVGLASVKHLVEKNKGKIVVSSHAEQGTCFSVCFPKAKSGREGRQHEHS